MTTTARDVAPNFFMPTTRAAGDEAREPLLGPSAPSASASQPARPPPKSLIAMAAIILIIYLLSPSKAVARIHSVVEPPQRALVEIAQCGIGGCPPPPPLDERLYEPLATQPSQTVTPPKESSSPPPPPPSLLHSPPPPEPGCDANGECSVAALVRRHAVDNTVVVTFGNMRQSHFTENWVYFLRKLGVGGLLVGMMNMRPTEPRYAKLATKLRGFGVGVYTVNSPQVKRQPQGGRWFHVLPLLRTGARVLLSDSDVVWLRDPRPYLKRLEQLHPRLDFTVSSDAQGGSDGRRLEAPPVPQRRRRKGRRAADDGGGGGGDGAVPGDGGGTGVDDLDIEAFGHCWTSMNIGIMHFPPGNRPGTLIAMQQAETHLSEENNLGRVDQGPINYRWKHGAGKWRWKRQLHAVPDLSGERLCGMVNGTSVGAVLPSAQFCNTLTHSVLHLWKYPKDGSSRTRPFALHATWMRNQAEPFKRMRLREEMVWRDRAMWYGIERTGNGGLSATTTSRKNADVFDSERAAHLEALGPTTPTAGYIAYEPILKPEWLELKEMVSVGGESFSGATLPPAGQVYKGGIPIHHLILIHEQLRQLRSALFIARSLNRALILPHTICSCEMGFFSYHLQTNCRANDHPTIHLPTNCSLDHYLDPKNLDESPFAHRERTFLQNPRTPSQLLRKASKKVVVCKAGDMKRNASPYNSNNALANFALGGEVRIPHKPTITQLRRGLLGTQSSRLLVFDDVLSSFGGWGDAPTHSATDELRQWHEDAQALLSSWCCTDDKRFKRLAGVIPYLLPPLEGAERMEGHERLSWAASALAEVFEIAKEPQRAAEIRPPT